MAQSERIAQILNQDLGTATISHPYHPLNGQSFPVLKIRRLPSGRRYSLLVEEDVISVPESWISPPDFWHTEPCYFNSHSLLELLELVQALEN